MSEAARRAILVHGLWAGRPSLALLARRLRSRGWTPDLFGYSTAFETIPRVLERLLERAGAEDAPVLDWVGQSLGGLLIVRLLAEHGDALPPGRVVLLGTPLNGSAAARRLDRVAGARAMLGHARRLLVEGVDALPPSHPVGMIAGNRGLGLGRLVARLEAPHDGTVSVSETQHPGLAGHRVMPVTHTSMAFSGAVARAAAHFLQHGRFPDPDSAVGRV
ncbi:MAG: alpha/beta fold hydrolase [Wenzhouxiangellaceae bacterium]